jgi:hypothetical protein
VSAAAVQVPGKRSKPGDFLRQTGEMAKRILARVDIRTGIGKIDFG